MSTENADEKKVSIKFLFSNPLAGSLIGSGGKSIKELIEVSDARVNVSGINDTYPGTSERIVLINGNIEAVSLAQTLVWEMLGLVSRENPKTVEWSPKSAVGSLGQNDEVQVSAKITIPAPASGMIIGRGGATIRSITEDSKAKVLMSSKEEALFTQERVITISGEVGQCIKCTDLILAKLNEHEEVPEFANRGTTYSSPMGMNSRQPRGKGVSNEKEGVDVIAESKITMSVPDDAVGNIFGKQGVTMREIISLSHAKIEVSPRGEFADGTKNRVVTITGTASATQTAHMLICQRMQNPTTAPRKAGAAAAKG